MKLKISQFCVIIKFFSHFYSAELGYLCFIVYESHITTFFFKFSSPKGCLQMTRYVLLFSFSVIAISFNAMSRNKSNTQIFPYSIFLYVSFYFYFLRTLLLNVYSPIYEFRSLTAIPQDNIFIKIYFLHHLFKFIQLYIFPFLLS